MKLGSISIALVLAHLFADVLVAQEGGTAPPRDSHEYGWLLPEGLSIDAIAAGKQFIEEVRLLKRQHQKAVSDADATLARLMTEKHSALADRLEAARKKAMKSDDLDKAIAIRDLILQVQTHGNPPEDADESKDEEGKVPSALVGTWTGKWGTTGVPLLVRVSPNWSVHVQKSVSLLHHRGRYLAVGLPFEQLEFIPASSNRLIVLGFNRKRDIFSDQPNHAAILTRSK